MFKTKGIYQLKLFSLAQISENGKTQLWKNAVLEGCSTVVLKWDWDLQKLRHYCIPSALQCTLHSPSQNNPISSLFTLKTTLQLDKSFPEEMLGQESLSRNA